VKGVRFSDAYSICKIFLQNGIEVKYIHLTHLLQAKEAAGRYKDKNDIEQLLKKKTS